MSDEAAFLNIYADGALVIAAVLGSLGVGVLLSVEGQPVGDVTAAAYAWSIGVASGMWVFPTIKEATA